MNIETDILGKYVAKFLNGEENKTNKDAKFMESLAKGGYI